MRGLLVFLVSTCVLINTCRTAIDWDDEEKWMFYDEKMDYMDHAMKTGLKTGEESHPLYQAALMMLRYIQRPTLTLESYLFPWLRDPQNVMTMVGQWRYQRGIAITTGDKYFAHTAHLIRTIREIWNSNIFIEIFYIGDNDLHPDHINYFNRQPNVECRDLYKIYKEHHLNLKGWQAKPFAMLASRAREVLLLDADAVLFMSPDSFFEHHQYIKTGGLFFYDRFIRSFIHDWKSWFKKIIPSVRRSVLSNKMSTQYTSYLMEAGALAVDKKRNLHGVLMTCILNSPPHVSEIYAMTHGEKESYWIAFEMVRASYYFVPTLAAAIGECTHWFGSFKSPTGQICDNLAHFHDVTGEPWWMNDGVLRNKHDSRSGVKSLVHYSRAEFGRWNEVCFEGESKMCLEGEIRDLPNAPLMRRILELWNPDV
jgi:hypothetical protein